MTANHEHTPTTEQVRFAATFPNENFSLKGTDFDRWLAERDARISAAAEQRGAIKALRGASKSWFTLADQMDHAPGKYYAGFWLKECADRIANKEGDDA